MDIVVLIYGGVFLIIALGVMSAVALGVNEERCMEEEEEREKKELEITPEDKGVIEEILQKHKWEECFSKIYSTYGNVSQSREVAAYMAIKKAESFAIANGYEVSVIKKMYYWHNVENAIIYTEPVYKNVREEDIYDWFGNFVETGRRYTYKHHTNYQYGFFILV